MAECESHVLAGSVSEYNAEETDSCCTGPEVDRAATSQDEYRVSRHEYDRH